MGSPRPPLEARAQSVERLLEQERLLAAQEATASWSHEQAPLKVSSPLSSAVASVPKAQVAVRATVRGRTHGSQNSNTADTAKAACDPRQAIARTLQSLGQARIALAEVVKGLEAEADRDSERTARLLQLQADLGLSLAGLGQELSAARLQLSRLRRVAERPAASSLAPTVRRTTWHPTVPGPKRSLSRTNARCRC